MNKNTSSRSSFVAALALASFAVCAAWADNQMVPFTPQSGGTGSGCPGLYTGTAKMTNSTGSFWITPPANATNGILTDVSGFPAPYTSVACVKSRTNLTWCQTNSVSFPATNSTSYLLTIYVKSPLPPPTNGQPMNIQITWQ
ncbi:MAG: hypothetical protein P4N60_21475 [Verrucomicrobiae bacterium]|nr:hypothetical protein [Verrucomicrobiae bacterium]